MAPDGSDELGFRFPRRFGILTTCLGDLEITDPAIEVLAVDDERARPIVLRRKLGQGAVYFLNSWAYPGAFDQDFGPGSTRKSPGLVGMIYRHIAKITRGDVWMTDDGDEPGQECEHINFSYFPEARIICLYNIDFNGTRAAWLHHFGKSERIALAPGEFRMMETAA